MNHGEERSFKNKEKKEFPRMQRVTRQLNANTSASPAWSCNCSMITCHVIVCIMCKLNIKVKINETRT